MGLFKSITRSVRSMFGRGYNDARWQRAIDQQYLAQLRREDLRLVRDLREELDAWYNNPYLRELIAPSYASKAVSAFAESVKSGLRGTKKKIQESAAAKGLGRAFAARQNFLADLSAAGQISAARGQQELRRFQVGAQREEQYRQAKGDIEQLRSDLYRQRLAFEHGSRSAYSLRQGMRKEAQGRILGTLVGAGAGAVLGGAGTLPGGVLGGASIGGQLASGLFSGMPALGLASAASLYQMFQQPQPAVAYAPMGMGMPFMFNPMAMFFGRK
ncbi:MAG: hypothetical protein GXP62_04025 [Oligoflexia bacterium]|nr:hypothetical protein [Oligoflexia bacterium]